mmetsp:Transcript_15199/g.21681  ORF Transcript_15199/g.21681 Transcript_15199/m.21681 type:complete len:334 (-) Transcript_15199:434-1435(-)
MSTVESSLREFVKRQRDLLQLELRSEREEEAVTTNDYKKTTSRSSDERSQNVLRNLEAESAVVGLLGRTVLTLVPRKSGNISSSSSLHDDSLTNRNVDAVKIEMVKTKQDASMLLPAHRFTVGDEVDIVSSSSGQNGNKKNPSGVISAVSETSISIAIFERNARGNNRGGESNTNTASASGKCKKNTNSRGKKHNGDDQQQVDDEDDHVLGMTAPLSIVPRSSVEVHAKMTKSLEELDKHGFDHPIASNVIRAIFDPSSYFIRNTKLKDEEMRGDANKTSGDMKNEHTKKTKIHPYNSNLDESQLEAIQFALEDSRPLALIRELKYTIFGLKV